ncbi:hypothetical protein LINPERHAP2_LOCUS36529 [Linum perenne]
MLLPVLQDTNTTSVPASSDHHNIADIKLNEINNLGGLKV